MKPELRKSILISCFATIFFLGIGEAFSRYLAHKDLLSIRYYPTSSGRVLADLDSNFGVWRYPNTTTRHPGICFDVSYETNSFGMRDKETSHKKKNINKKNIVFLGDSFIEGFGVETKNRISEIFSKNSNIDSLNFGVSGNFGSTQEYLLYKELASNFEHDAVALFLLPDNDFSDNNPEVFDEDRYRPYLRKKGSDYEVYYTVAFEDRKQITGMSFGRRMRRHLYNNIYILNCFRQIGDLITNSSLRKKIKFQKINQSKSSYDNYTKEDLEKLTWAYLKIAKLASPRVLYIYIIPREGDFLKFSNNHVWKPRLVNELKRELSNASNIKIVDLFPHFTRYMKINNTSSKEFFLSCDGHWSKLGHTVAAEAVQRSL